jgi:hypothetical protein
MGRGIPRARSQDLPVLRTKVFRFYGFGNHRYLQASRHMKDIKQRFDSKYVKADSGCWNWTASRTRDGYGKMSVAGKTVASHRASWLLNHGDIPDGLFVLHECDNRLCVNPNHLFLGTTSDNMVDCILKGRHGRKKLSKDQIEYIRSYAGSSKEPAKALGISRAMFCRIRKGNAWSFA